MQERSIQAAFALQTGTSRLYVALAVMVASGFAGLGYQIVWTQQGASWLGHESLSVLAVIAAFFGGLAVGAFVSGSRIDRSRRPVRWYAACEMTTGIWSLALAFQPAQVTGRLIDLIGPQPSLAWHWTVAFCGTFFLLLPATAAMGATLPAMERILDSLCRQRVRIAALYAGNTLGAVLGVLCTAFWLIPQFGLARTANICAAISMLCAAAAMTLLAQPVQDAPAQVRSPARGVPVLLTVTGLMGIGYEVMVVRVLSQVAENTVYTFAILLAVYLVGTALGAAAYIRWLSGTASGDAREQLRDRLLRVLAGACLVGMLPLAAAETFKGLVVHLTEGSMVAALGAEAALALATFLLPTIAMGALFSHLAAEARAAGVSFGHALAVNTVGAAVAPLLFGVGLVPALGTTPAFLLIAAAYLVLMSRRAWSGPLQWVSVGGLAALAAWGPSLAIVTVPMGGRLISYAEGAMATVSVVEDADGVARLHINNRQQEGSSATRFNDSRQALLPILLHPSPRRALFLGLGTGITSLAAAHDPALQVDAVELLPEVVDASSYFISRADGDAPHPRLHVKIADARRFVRASRARYDVIVSDNFHPARSGSASLYTVEHFAAVRARLAAGGLFCQWLPLHQLDLDSLRSIVRTFQSVYPRGWALLATNSLDTPVLGLVARTDEGGFDLGGLRERLAVSASWRSPSESGIADEFALLGSFVAGPAALARFAGDAPLNTDDHPVVAYLAPRITYAPDSLPRIRLTAFLQQVDISAPELFAASQDAAWTSRLVAYWTARNRFIETGRDVQPTSDVKRMLAQVRKPLLEVLQISPDFRPAYDPLLRMAKTLSDDDIDAARILLTELVHAQPSRPEALEALLSLPKGSESPDRIGM